MGTRIGYKYLTYAEYDQEIIDQNYALFIKYQTFIEGDNEPPPLKRHGKLALAKERARSRATAQEDKSQPHRIAKKAGDESEERAVAQVDADEEGDSEPAKDETSEKEEVDSEPAKDEAREKEEADSEPAKDEAREKEEVDSEPAKDETSEKEEVEEEHVTDDIQDQIE